MKIVIIGNGFDLANGLPTSFKDYFIYKTAPLENLFNNIISFLNDLKIPSLLKENVELYKSFQYANAKILPVDMDNADKSVLYNKIKIIFGDFKTIKLSFWDLFFWYLIRIENTSQDLSWFNVETIINDFIFNKNSSQKVNIKNLDNYIRKDIINMQEFRLPNTKTYIKKEYLDDILNTYEFKDKLLILFGEVLKIKGSDSNFSIHDILLSELCELEESFRCYITLIMDHITPSKTNKSIYRDNFLELINNKSSNRFFYLLNFNYSCISSSLNTEAQVSQATGSVIIQRGKIKYNVIEVNVHGNFNRIAIFGVDQSKVPADDPGYIFTKTYRKISNQEKLISFSLPHIKDIDEIVFFGHSLSVADYSYFQSIFDYYDIYHSNIKLTFKYSLYEGKPPELIKKECYDSIIKLIRSYGETMDNVNHGNNLVHKLLLENRLEVQLTKLKKIDISLFHSQYIKDFSVLEPITLYKQ